ncbi:DUF5818 domain-containing protein [Blastomonas natatoria]|uniref:DUF5818 domain-containing protein n=1 Tax=Blastomonas natatoria TaxID=34015 RepID=UPI001FC9E1AE|nr:DUF5818 domain-containing protein [Blastomonas natatoria]
MPPAIRRRSLLRDDPYANGAAMGPVLERASMSVSPDLHLRGELVEGPLGLVLQAGGGHWELDAPRSARRLVGREVEITGHRAGFNGLICKQVWPAGTAQPRRIQLPIERLFVGGFVIYGLLATLAGLAGQLS